MQFSVIICAHNSRPDYLRRVFDALREQTLPKEQWELLLVDNASKEPLAGNYDLSWHPCGRHVRENELGLTAARLRGIRETEGEILVFVDDDNVLMPDYLAKALEIADRCPFIGAWAGQVEGEFEKPLAPELDPFRGCLVLGTVPSDIWTNTYESLSAIPFGAGMCIRRAVATAYAQVCRSDSRRQTLDRIGNALLGGGDVDLAYTAIDQGYGMGRFKALRVLHLIPRRRVDPEYL
jgi:glycosyltransferase involved in cell wall biosynthesis